MKKITLGNTGIQVSELCFGVLPIGPNQKNIPLEEAGEVIASALQQGVTFFDTAQVYKTYPHLKRGMDLAGIRPVISSKSPAQTYAQMEEAILECLKSLAIEQIDIFLMHAARVETTVFEERAGALQCLKDYREKGVLRAIGISTHNVDVATAAATHPDLDIVFPILNNRGLGILNGSVADMENAIERCYENGKGVFLMKALGGGNLVNDYATSVEYVRNFAKERSPIAMGMVNKEEVAMNIHYFDGKDMTEVLRNLHVPKKRMTVIPMLCKGCGHCVAVCHSSAIAVVDGTACIEEDQCITCGYCVGACPEFAIRMV